MDEIIYHTTACATDRYIQQPREPGQQSNHVVEGLLRFGFIGTMIIDIVVVLYLHMVMRAAVQALHDSIQNQFRLSGGLRVVVVMSMRRD